MLRLTAIILRVAFLAAALAGALVLWQGQPAHAAAMTVTTTDDEINADGDCSLREAIQAANTDAAVDACPAGLGADTIDVPTGNYTLSIAGAGEDANATGDLDITANLTITGTDAATTIIDGGDLDRVFHIHLTFAGVTANIAAVTIQNGFTAVVGSSLDRTGGGLLNQGTATLMNVTVSGNTANLDGGGILSSPLAPDASSTLTVTNSTINGNSAGASGGGISNGGTATLTNVTVSGNTASNGGGIGNGGTATLTNSIVSGNSVDAGSGGILNGFGATATLSNSTISGNTAQSGGGIGNDGTAILTNVTVSGNSVGFRGGGIANSGTLTLNNSTVSGNSAGGEGGGIWGQDGTLAVTASTVSGNSADFGGGIFHRGSVALSSSTVSGNSANFDGGGIYIFGGIWALSNVTVSGNSASNNNGGGIFGGGTVTLSNSTISGNSALNGAGIASGGTWTLNSTTISGNSTGQDGQGGGIANGGTVTLTNSTVSGNSACHGGGMINRGDMILSSSTVSDNSAACLGSGIFNLATVALKNTIVTDIMAFECLGTITSAGYNLIETHNCPIAGDTTGNMIGVDPMLGPLADNGGPTQTHALLPGSPAIDAGSPDCPPPATDQRGVARPQGAACDIGAFELEVPAYDFAGFFIPVDNPPVLNSVKAGSAVPVKFSLGGDQGLDIFATGYPKSQKVGCDTSAPLDTIEETVTAGSSSLSYDPIADRYVYVWKTGKTWAGTCRQLIVRLNDGADHVANFRFK